MLWHPATPSRNYTPTETSQRWIKEGPCDVNATPLQDNGTPTRNFILNLKTELRRNFFLFIVHNLPSRLLYRIIIKYILYTI